MAAGTYTSTVFANSPLKAVHIGTNTIKGQFTSTAPTSPPNSLGDVIFLAKIPHGAVITDFAFDHSSTETTFGMKYGLASGWPTGGGASLSFLSPSLAIATVKTRYTGGTIARDAARTTSADPYRISVSDSDPNRYGIVAAKIATASASTTFIVNFSITYRMDDPQQ